MPGACLVVQEWQEHIAAAAGNRRGLVEKAAGEHHGPAGGRAVRARAELGEAKVATFILFGIQVDSDGEAPMRGTFGGIVAVCTEVRPLGAVVTGDNVALHASGLELEGLFDLGKQAMQDPILDGLSQDVIIDTAVRAPLEGMIQDKDGFAVPFAHKARVRTATAFVIRNQIPAKRRFKYPGQYQHRRMWLKAAISSHGRQGGHKTQQFANGRQGKLAHHTKHGVQHQEKRFIGPLTIGPVFHGAVQAADGQVEIPEVADAGQQLADSPVGAIRGIDADTEKAGRLVIKQLMPIHNRLVRLGT